MTDWIDNLKAGDEVMVGHGIGTIRYRKATVTKIGKLHIIVGKSKFRRDGRLAGNDPWSHLQIYEPTEKRREIKRRQDALEAVQSCRSWDKLTTDELEEIVGWINSAIRKEPATS